MKPYSIPDHITWKFNGVQFGHISNSPGTNFSFQYNIPSTLLPTTNLSFAIQESLVNLSSYGVLAICISGADSEIIAREAKSLGVPFELWFLDMWGINTKARSKAQQLATDLAVHLNVVTLTKDEAYGSVIIENHKMLQAEKPTYLCLPFLFSHIPTSDLIVGGEGDPQKSGPEYERFVNASGNYDGLPISATEVFYRQWAMANNRNCEMYFYSSTPLLTKSYYEHPLLIKANKRIDTRHLVDTLWPNLIFNYKTTNWEDLVEANADIRNYVRSISGSKFNAIPAVCLTAV
jgi:hypothetical protein